MGSASNSTSQPATETPVLVYDANCMFCRRIAFWARVESSERIKLVSLTDPEADDLLGEFYDDDWPENFYLIENGSCRKGGRALPRILRLVGIGSFGSFVSEYLSYKANEWHPDSGHATEQQRSREQGTSRKPFASVTSAAARPLASVASKLPRTRPGLPPEDIEVNVAVVSPNGDGGFSVEVRESQESVRKSRPNPSGNSPVGMPHRGDENILSEKLDGTPGKNDGGGPEGGGPGGGGPGGGGPGGGGPGGGGPGNNGAGNATVDIRRKRRGLEVRDPSRLDPEKREAIERFDEIDIYSIQVDHRRFGVGINFGEGPVVTGAGPSEATTLSTQIQHDVAEPIVDFVTYQNGDDEDVATHLDAYGTGISTLADHHDEQGSARIASVYREIADTSTKLQTSARSATATTLLPVKNHAVLSGIPDFLQYVETPTVAKTSHFNGSHDLETTDTDLVWGMNCGCGCCCGCCCSCGCGCGCGICGCSCYCFCCCGSCRCGCGCGCCVCSSDYFED